MILSNIKIKKPGFFILFFIYFCFIGLNSYSQSERFLSIPKEFENPTEKSLSKSLSQLNISKGSGTVWKVYSDRENNYTYNSPRGTKQHSTLSFMEEFRVTRIDGNFLQLCDKLDSKTSYGWINKDKLILWSHSIKDSKTGIPKKAMILSTFEGTTSEVVDDQFVSYMKDPDFEYDSYKKARLFEILFIYKSTDDAVLIGSDYLIGDGNKIDVLTNIKGWVPIDRVTFWNHKICIEPDWEVGAYNNRLNNDVIPAVFADEISAMEYSKGNSNIDEDFIIWENELKEGRRYEGQWRRFPILDHNNSIYQVGAMGKIQSSEGPELSQEQFAAIRSLLEIAEQKARRVNIVFVIDGTESMKPYYKPIYDAINKSVQNLKYSRNQYRFGAVIYRDKDKNDDLYELLPLSSDSDDILNFLNNTKTNYKDDNKDFAEAVNYGLWKGLNSCRFEQNESNFIILVGDAGNHKRNDETQILDEDVIEKLVEYECSLISFQVNNGNHETYDDFIHKSQYFVIQTAQQIRESYSETKRLWQPDGWDNNSAFFESVGPNKYSLNQQEIVGSFLFPDKNGTLPYNILQEEIEEKIGLFEERISTIIAIAKGIIGGGRSLNESDEYHDAVIQFLSKLKGLTPQEISQLRQSNYQFSMDGYTSKTVTLPNSFSNIGVFKEVVFLTNHSVVAITGFLSRVVHSQNSAGTVRRVLQNAYIEEIEYLLGGIAKEEILGKTMHELNTLILGIPARGSFLDEVKLEDLTDPSKVSDAKIEEFVTYMGLRYDEFLSIVQNDYEQSFTSNGVTYYWIPVDVFP